MSGALKEEFLIDRGIKISVKDGRRVVEGLGYYPSRKVGDLRELVKESARIYGDAAAFRFKGKKGEIAQKSYREFDRDIDCLGTSLMSLGLKGSNISVIGENRYEWGVCYYSILNGIGVAVPLDKYLPKNEVENLIGRAGAEAIFYSPAFHSMMLDMARSDDRIRYYICMDEMTDVSVQDSRFMSLPGLFQKGKKLLEEGDRSFIDAHIDREQMSILLFTSGTTSTSKGVMLSHANVAFDACAISTIIYTGPGDVHLSLLPMHHTFENTIGLAFMVHSGVCVAFSEGIRHLAQNLQEFDVSILVAVPAVYEAMYRKVQEGIKKTGKEKPFKILLKVSEILRLLGLDFRRKFFNSVFKQLGPRLRLVISGAAPIDPEIIIWFDRLGMKLIQGYGLTETSPVVAANNDFVNKPGTVGYPMAGIETAVLSPDENGMGELMTRGGHVMLGYYQDPEATAEVLDEAGWLRTGDLCTIDNEGFIRITGRVKSMIVLSNGKKAFPEEFETLLNKIPGIADSFVWGNEASDGDIQVCAKLVIDKEYMQSAGMEQASQEELGEIFETAIREINRNLPQYKIIRYFVMSEDELVKTTTLKIRRPVEYERVRNALESAGVEMRKASGKFIERLKA